MADTRLFITEEPPKSPIATKTFIHTSPSKSSPIKKPPHITLAPKPTSSLLHSQKIDFDLLLETIPPDAIDPLPSPLFHKAHRRAERQEKQLRNIEKERAQHEKVQLERLLEGLRGPDWLRVMGISGVTEGDRKSWEGKRAWCIREVNGLIEKFRVWKEEERRRKAEKEMSVRDDEEEEDEDDMSIATGSHDPTTTSLSRATPTNVDALAALQLHTESLSATHPRPHLKTYSRVGRPKLKAATAQLPTACLPLAAPAALDRPFTSFFTKPHQRAAAMEKHRRSGRTRFAFGLPLPEIEEREFELPSEMLTDEARRASARSRRRQRRSGVAEGKT